MKGCDFSQKGIQLLFCLFAFKVQMQSAWTAESRSYWGVGDIKGHVLYLLFKWYLGVFGILERQAVYFGIHAALLLPFRTERLKPCSGFSL